MKKSRFSDSQPLVDPQTGQLQALEALMRIREDDDTLIPPMEFIPLAEETRLIIPLGEKMIHLALHQLKLLTENGQSIRMCLNVSPVQFTNPGFLLFLLSSLKTYGLNPALIALEVTESLMMEHLDQVRQDMATFKAQGISISIDDFGTGFSSLSYLRDLPVDVLKIDKSFVAQITPEQPDDVLVRTIASLAQSMGLRSVAEVVETAHQVRCLNELGGSLLQGFYFSRPVPAVGLKSWYPI